MSDGSGFVNASDTSEYGETRAPSKKLVSRPLITYSLWLVFNDISNSRLGIDWDIDIESNHPKGYPPQRDQPRYWRRICQAKVLILDEIPAQLRDEIKFTIDTHRVRLIENKTSFDKPTFVLNCLAAINIDPEVLEFWERLKAAGIWGIKKAVDCYNSGHLNSAFEAGPAFQEPLVAPRALGSVGLVIKEEVAKTEVESESHSTPSVSSSELGAEIEVDMDGNTVMLTRKSH